EAKNNRCLTGDVPQSACINKDIIKFFWSSWPTLKNQVSSSFDTNFNAAGIYFISLGVNYNNTNYNFNSQSQNKGPLKIVINPPKLTEFSHQLISKEDVAVINGKRVAENEMIFFDWKLDSAGRVPVERFEVWRALVGGASDEIKWEQIKQADKITPVFAIPSADSIDELDPPASGTYNYGLHLVLADGSYLTEGDAGQNLIPITFNRQITPPSTPPPAQYNGPIVNSIFNQKTSTGRPVISWTIDNSADNSAEAKVANFELWRQKSGESTHAVILESIPIGTLKNNNSGIYLFVADAGEIKAGGYYYIIHAVPKTGITTNRSPSFDDLKQLGISTGLITISQDIKPLPGPPKMPGLPRISKLAAVAADQNFNIRWGVETNEIDFVSKFEIWRAPCKSSDDSTIDKNTWVKINTINNDHTETNNDDFEYYDSRENGGYCYGMHVYSTYDDALYTTEEDNNIPLAYVFSDDTAPTISKFLVNDKEGGLDGPDIVVAPGKSVKISWKATDGGWGSGIARVEIWCHNGIIWDKCSEDITAVKLASGTLTDGSYNFTIPFETEMILDLGIHVVKDNGKWVSEQGGGLSSVKIKIEKECVATKTCADFDLTRFCGSKSLDNGCSVNMPCTGTLRCPNGCAADNTCTAAAPTPDKPPTISKFNIDPVSFVEKESANISWEVEDHSGLGGLGIDRVEIWIKRTEESWGVEPTIINENMTIKNYNYIMPDAGTFDFGIHVVDKKGNMTKESATIKVTVTSNADSSGSCGGVATARDIEGNIYSTVAIGAQCWMKSNLRTTKYPDGTPITKGGCSTDACSWGPDSGYYSCPPDTSWDYFLKRENCANAATAGMMYQWSAATHNSTVEGAQGICPSGWHVPSDAEWTTLTTYLGGASIAGNKLKHTIGWSTPNIGTNSSGFTALPASMLNSLNYYYYAYFWSSGTNAYVRGLSAVEAKVSRRDYTNWKGNGISVRCLKGAATDEDKGTANGNNGNNNDTTKLPTISNANFSVVRAQGTGEYVFSIASSPYPYEKKKPIVLLKWDMDNNDPAAGSIKKFMVSRAPKNTTQWEPIGEDGKNSSGSYSRYDNTLPDATKKYQYKIDAFANGTSEPLVSQAVTGPLDSDDDWISDADEKSSGTNPNKADSDGDLLSDWEENYTFGYFNTIEQRLIHTNPNNVNTDGDKYSDYDEITHCYSPFSYPPSKYLDYNVGCVK
ncbi:hypothetical protein COU00_02035, partial [Candidatus Falkowbacteria bacterium CG10_big_fil_rev_8_21_14_0_10_43_11]